MRRERIFLANLGIGQQRIALVSVVAITTLEAVVGVIAKVGLSG